MSDEQEADRVGGQTLIEALSGGPARGAPSGDEGQ